MVKDLKRASARGVAWNLIQNLVARLLSLVVVAILARYLDRSAFGAIALALTVTALGELLIGQGYGEFIAQRPDLSDSHKDTAFWFNVVLGAALTLIIVAAAAPIASLVAEESVAPVVRWLSISLFLRSLAIVPGGLLVRQMNFRALSLRTIVAAAIGGAAGVVAAVSGLGLYSLIIQTLVTEAVGLVALWRAASWWPRWRFSVADLKDLSKFGTPIFGGALLNFVSRRLDTVIVGRALGIASLGMYSLAQRVFQIMNQVLNKSGDAVVFSALAKLTEPERRRQGFYQVVEVSAALCFPVYAGLAVAAEPVISVLFGERWSDSGPVLAWFGIAGIPISLSYLNAAALKSAGHTRGYFALHAILVCIYLPLLLVLVQRGAAASSLAYLLAVGLIVPVEVYLVRTALGIRVAHYIRAFLTPMLAAAVMTGAILAVNRAVPPLVPVAALAVDIAVGIVVYVIVLRVIGPATFRRCVGVVRSVIERRTKSPESTGDV